MDKLLPVSNWQQGVGFVLLVMATNIVQRVGKQKMVIGHIDDALEKSFTALVGFIPNKK